VDADFAAESGRYGDRNRGDVMTLQGGCACGYVRYEVSGAPAKETICHCSTCRRTSGAPFVAWFTVPAQGYRILAGAPARFESSAEAERTFCPRCGTALTYRSRRFTDEVDVTTCSLDEPERIPPRDHTYVRSRLSWVKVADGLPEFETTR
jgi:hypothetical protein